MTDDFDLEALRRRLDTAPDGAVLRPVGLESVFLGQGALEYLPEVVVRLAAVTRRSGPVAVLSDLTPKRYRSGELLEFVTKSVSSVVGVRGVFVGTPGHGAHADEATLAKARRDCEGASCLVAVGSGTVADIGKVIAAAHGIAYVIVQTADSVNGYADDRSVLLVNGVKRTVPSKWADVLIADVDVLVDAPVAMNAAGLADLIAMFTAPADWYLANLLGMDDSYSPTVVALAREQGPALLKAARFVPTANRVALGQISAALTLSGISMGIAGTTAACSGMEHAASHLLEMAAVKAGDDVALHGAQVGVASIVAALLWQRVLDELADGRPLAGQGARPGRVRDRCAGRLLGRRPERGDGRGVLARLRAQARPLGAGGRADRAGGRAVAFPRPGPRQPPRLAAVDRRRPAQRRRPCGLLRARPVRRPGRGPLGRGELPSHA